MLALRNSEGAGKLSQMTTPFLYNPRKSLTARVRWLRMLSTHFVHVGRLQGSTLVVTDEPLEFVITLRNPFVFDLDIQSLSLR